MSSPIDLKVYGKKHVILTIAGVMGTLILFHTEVVSPSV